jgi:hypothetical protein
VATQVRRPLMAGNWKMNVNHVEAALCFPNTVPRFCAQTFYEGSDHELGLACIRAYNAWMVEEWSGTVPRAAGLQASSSSPSTRAP